MASATEICAVAPADRLIQTEVPSHVRITAVHLPLPTSRGCRLGTSLWMTSTVHFGRPTNHACFRRHRECEEASCVIPAASNILATSTRTLLPQLVSCFGLRLNAKLGRGNSYCSTAVTNTTAIQRSPGRGQGGSEEGRRGRAEGNFKVAAENGVHNWDGSGLWRP
ncbi:hypothetical protein AC578_10032 [Pseudocercospora eumusae]|uniref:Uncharacterized protein n=1 Tax=Pseudocercospora eumusae TaxID=321146 RepID=A0A139H6J9_9PEZI|nr:hypothetical protein AC578_10032 [Pseudocercospora eumusae]